MPRRPENSTRPKAQDTNARRSTQASFDTKGCFHDGCGGSSSDTLGLFRRERRRPLCRDLREGESILKIQIPRDRVLYLSFTGILEPLGYSQVFRLLRGLSKAHVRYALVSLERARDLAQLNRLAEVKSELEAVGIDWIPIRYLDGSARNIASNLARALAAVLQRIKRGDVRLIHARGYMAASVALAAKSITGVPYIFDFRGYWVDERRESGRWFVGDRRYRAGKQWERSLFAGCCASVSLTEAGAEDVRTGVFGPWPSERPSLVIPTCVDFDAFSLRRGEEAPARHHRLAGKLVVGFIGSLNASYRVTESIELFLQISRLRDDAHLLCLTSQVEEITTRLAHAGVGRARFTALNVPHTEIADWLHQVDWGLLVLNTPYAKRASMPTKLGEFFASGVAPLHEGCNADVARWISRSGCGHTLSTGTPAGIAAGAHYVASTTLKIDDLREARRRTEAHFSLASGIERYHKLLSTLLGEPGSV
ncbi:MAG: glycosyltransferase [Deltaproteobacteria bacterium]|nr:glycosyltransferase [Deltaproteobacteria bacterium]